MQNREGEWPRRRRRNRSPLSRFIRWVSGLVQIAAVLRDVP